jgi:hypothetical protein
MVHIYGIFIHLFLGWICPGMNVLRVWEEGREGGRVVLAEAGQKTISRYCPFKGLCFIIDWICPGTNAFAGVEEGRGGGGVVLAEAGQKTIPRYCPFKVLCFFLGWICPGTNVLRV